MPLLSPPIFVLFDICCSSDSVLSICMQSAVKHTLSCRHSLADRFPLLSSTTMAHFSDVVHSVAATWSAKHLVARSCSQGAFLVPYLHKPHCAVLLHGPIRVISDLLTPISNHLHPFNHDVMVILGLGESHAVICFLGHAFRWKPLSYHITLIRKLCSECAFWMLTEMFITGAEGRVTLGLYLIVNCSCYLWAQIAFGLMPGTNFQLWCHALCGQPATHQSVPHFGVVNFPGFMERGCGSRTGAGAEL